MNKRLQTIINNILIQTEKTKISTSEQIIHFLSNGYRFCQLKCEPNLSTYHYIISSTIIYNGNYHLANFDDIVRIELRFYDGIILVLMMNDSVVTKIDISASLSCQYAPYFLRKYSDLLEFNIIKKVNCTEYKKKVLAIHEKYI